MVAKLKFALIALSLVVCNIAEAQQLKCVEKSSKSRPSWVTNIERGYLTASASAVSVDAAQTTALLGIKQQIAQSIASNITVEVMQSTSSMLKDGECSEQSTTEDMIRSTTEKIPSLQSISISRASGFYWEKYYDKKSNTTRYDYYIKYPFSDLELHSLVEEFNAEQREIDSTMERLQAQMHTIAHIEDIEANVSELRALFARFSDSDARIAQTNEIISRYRSLYKNISFVEREHNNKRVVIEPMLNGRKMKISQIPQHKSNCADRVVKKIEDGCVVINYDDFACYSGEDNFIELTFKFGVNYVKTNIYIKK